MAWESWRSWFLQRSSYCTRTPAPTLRRLGFVIRRFIFHAIKASFTGLRRDRGRVGNGAEVWIQQNKTGQAWAGKPTLTADTVRKSARQCRFSPTCSLSHTDGFSSSSKSKVKSLLFKGQVALNVQGCVLKRTCDVGIFFTTKRL